MRQAKEALVNIFAWSALVQFGINALTGEACRYSMRLLCDLNEDGRALMAEYLGVEPSAFAANWNSTVDGKPAVASVMLHRDSLRQLAEFALSHTGALASVIRPEGITGCYTAEAVQLMERLEEVTQGSCSVRHNHASTSAPFQGSRNVHVATGRAA